MLLSLSSCARGLQGEKCQELALIVTSHDFYFTMAIFFILGSLMNIDQIHPYYIVSDVSMQIMELLFGYPLYFSPRLLLVLHVCFLLGSLSLIITFKFQLYKLFQQVKVNHVDVT